MENVTATATPAGACHFTLDVRVPAAAVAAAFKKARQQFRNQLRVPGFRPGKAPEALLRQRFAPQIVAEVQQALVRDGLRAAMQARGLAPVTLPTLLPDKEGQVAEGQEFAFAVEFDVAPQFELPVYTGLALTRPMVAVTDENVEHAIDELRRQRASYEAVPAPAGPGHLLKAACHAELAETAAAPASVQRLLHTDETWLLLNPPELLPGATAALTGATAGTERTFPVSFPADYFESFLAGKQLTYTVKVIEVHARKLPDVTDAFAVSHGAADAADLRAKIRERLAGRIAEMQAETLRQQAIQLLLARGEFALPPKQLEMETRIALRELQQQRQGDDAPAAAPAAPAADLAPQAAQQAAGRLRLRYLVERIAKQEAITVETGEVQKQLDSFRQYQRLTETEFAKRYDAMRVAEAFYLELLRERVIEKVIAHAHITEQPLPLPAEPAAAGPASA